jgi:hypothetical protein
MRIKVKNVFKCLFLWVALVESCRRIVVPPDWLKVGAKAFFQFHYFRYFKVNVPFAWGASSQCKPCRRIEEF